jgi:hypothetical protein
LQKLVADVDSKSLELKVGAQVRLTMNWSVDQGLCNGTRGVVVGFEDREDLTLSSFEKTLFGVVSWPEKVPIVKFEVNSGTLELHVPEKEVRRAAER